MTGRTTPNERPGRNAGACTVLTAGNNLSSRYRIHGNKVDFGQISQRDGSNAENKEKETPLVLIKCYKEINLVIYFTLLSGARGSAIQTPKALLEKSLCRLVTA